MTKLYIGDIISLNKKGIDREPLFYKSIPLHVITNLKDCYTVFSYSLINILSEYALDYGDILKRELEYFSQYE